MVSLVFAGMFIFKNGVLQDFVKMLNKAFNRSI